MRSVRLLAGLTVLTLGAATAWLHVHPGVKETTHTRTTASVMPPAAGGLASVHIVLRDAGRRVADVRADRVTLSPDLRYAVLSPRAEGEVYERGRGSLRFRCHEIVIDRATNDLVMRGQIQVTSSSGDRVAAPDARWDARRQQLVFPRGIRLVSGTSTARARRASARAALQVLDLEDDVVVTFPLRGALP